MADEQRAACHIHRGDSVSTRLLHRHHVVPQGYGGKDTDDNVVWICASCHDVLHRLANFVLHGKQGFAQDLAVQYLPGSPKARDRLADLVKSAADAMETHIPDADDAEEEVTVQIRVPRQLHSRLKVLAGERNHAKSGRRVGLYRYIVEVLRAHVDIAMARPGAPPADSFAGPDDAPMTGDAPSETGDPVPTFRF